MEKQKEFTDILDESMNLELNVSDLYFLFFKLFPEDAEFWWQLVEEENNHAALIRSGKEYFFPINKFPERLLFRNIDELKSINQMICNYIERYSTITPSRSEAFTIALTFEKTAGELHFQEFMKYHDEITVIEQVFIRLNNDDLDHIKRLNDYMCVHAIPVAVISSQV